MLKPSALITYNLLRKAEMMMQQACIMAGIPQQTIQQQFDVKIDQAWQEVEQERAQTKTR